MGSDTEYSKAPLPPQTTQRMQQLDAEQPPPQYQPYTDPVQVKGSTASQQGNVSDSVQLQGSSQTAVVVQPAVVVQQLPYQNTIENALNTAVRGVGQALNTITPGAYPQPNNTVHSPPPPQVERMMPAPPTDASKATAGPYQQPPQIYHQHQGPYPAQSFQQGAGYNTGVIVSMPSAHNSAQICPAGGVHIFQGWCFGLIWFDFCFAGY